MSANTANPFPEMDFTKVMSAFKIPAVNTEGIMAAHKKNVDALTSAGQLTFESVQEITKRQGEMISQGVEELTGITKDAAIPSSIEESTIKGAQAVKTVYQSVLANSWDLNDMAIKTTSKSLGLINKRVAESLDEVEDYFTKSVKPVSSPTKATDVS